MTTPILDRSELPEFRELTDSEKLALTAQIPLVRRVAFCAGTGFSLIGAAIFGYHWIHYDRTRDAGLLWIGGAYLSVTMLIAMMFFASAFHAPAFVRGKAPWPVAGHYRGTLQVAGKPAHYIFGIHPVNLQRGWAGIPLFEKLEGEMTPPVGHLRRFEQRHQMLTVRTDDGRT